MTPCVSTYFRQLHSLGWRPHHLVPPPQYLIVWGHTTMSDSTGALVWALVPSSQSEQIWDFFFVDSGYTRLSFPQSFLLPHVLRHIWQKLSFFFSSSTIRLQWVPGHSFIPKNDTADALPSGLGCSSNPQSHAVLSNLFIPFFYYLGREAYCLIKFFNTQIPSLSTKELVLPLDARCVLSRLRFHAKLISP